MVSQNGRCSGYNLPKIQSDKKRMEEPVPKRCSMLMTDKAEEKGSWCTRLCLKKACQVWLVVYLPLWKMMEFVSWGWWHSQRMENQKNPYINNIFTYVNHIFMIKRQKIPWFQTTNQLLLDRLVLFLLKKPFHGIKLVVDPTAASGENNYLMYVSCFLLSKTSHYTIIRKRSLTYISSLKSQSFAC